MTPKFVVGRFINFHDARASVGWLYDYYLSDIEFSKSSFEDWLISFVHEVLVELEDFDDESKR